MRSRPYALALFCCVLALSECTPIQKPEESLKQDEHQFEGATFGSILNANEAEKDTLFEGDILLSKTRNAMQDKTARWGSTVPYVITDGYTYETRTAIISALQEIQVRSCLSFVERTAEQNYMKYVRGSGCYSSVGVKGGGQTVSIAPGCGSHRTIIHETFHALGFWHEQSRTDRDDYVRIVWDVITEGQEGNFDKYDSDTVDLMDMPYDYDSIMHYHDKAFSKNGSKTIIALKEGGENMGMIDAISVVDLAELNKLYEGEATLDASGHTEWTSWSTCDINCVRRRKRYCDRSDCAARGEAEEQMTGCDVECEVGLDPDCGSKTLTAISGTVESPLFPHKYKDEITCTKVIEAPEGARVQLSFQAFDVELNYDYVHVYDGADSSAPEVATYTGNKLPGDIISTSNRLTIVFDSDYAIVAGGFSANYYINPAPRHLCQFENYDDYCGWVDDTTAQLKFEWNSGSTPSTPTGPDNDHTYGSEFGHYLYLEASSVTPGYAASLISPIFQSSKASLCFSMWYNMYGTNTGTLNVFLVIDGLRQTSPLITFSGDLQHNNWLQAYAHITSSTAFQVAIEAVRFDGYAGDMAIDDVMLVEGPCPTA